MSQELELRNLAEAILREYKTGSIVSERHLQAVIYRELKESLLKGLELLVEPVISTKDKSDITGLIPDMLLVKDQKVQVIIEIKYVPHHYPEYQKDFQTFKAFTSAKKKGTILYLKVDPNNGQWSKDAFSIAEDLLTLYIAIGRSDSGLFTSTESIVKEAFKDTEKFNFQPLFILINPNNNPKQFEIRYGITNDKMQSKIYLE